MYMAGIHDRKIRKNENDLLDSIWARLQDSPADFSPEEEDLRDIRDRIMKKRRKTAGILSAAGIAAALFFMIFIPAWFRNEGSGEDSPVAKLRSMGVSVSDEQVSLKMDDDSSGRMLRLDVPSGKQFSLKLADGTSVWLNSESSIEYPASFDGCQERTVRLSGEAFFDVVSDESHPFIVQTRMGDIEVLGTRFNVNVYPEDTVCYTTLVEGRVAVNLPSTDDRMFLAPGQQAVFSGTHAEKREVNLEEYVGWVDGVYTFRDKKLRDIMQTFERWYNIDVVYEDASLADIPYTGSVKRYESILPFLEALHLTTDLHCRIEGRNVYLSKAQ